MANPPVPLDRLAGTIARMKAQGTSMGSFDPSKVAPIPATMSQATATARRMGSAAPVTSTPVPTDALSIKRAAEKATEQRMKAANPGMTDTEAQNAFIPESKMKKLCEVVKKVRKSYMEEATQSYDKSQRLSIIAPDHKVEDSPNARHLEEVLGRSNMSQLKVPSDKQSAINGDSLPLAKRTNSRYVYGEENTQDVEVQSKKKSDKELKQAAKDGVEVNPQIDDLKQE